MKTGNLYIPTLITFITLHINHLILTISQFSSKLYSFDYSDPTILNYLEGYANQGNIFEYKGYPTTNLQTYQPGPIPNIYIFKLSWVLNNFFDINPIYLSNILIATYPTILILIATTILYRNKEKTLSIMTLAITLLVQYTNNNFNASNKGPDRFDTGTDYVTLIATLTLILLVLSYKKPNSSHIPLLAFSGLLLNAHFTAFALAPFTIIYGIYQIILSTRVKKYNIQYKIIIPLFIVIYLPLIYRFLVEPLYLYNALKVKSYPFSERILPDEWVYFFKTTPLQLFINPCESNSTTLNNLSCLPYNYVKLSVIIFAALSLIITFILIKKQNIFIKSLIFLSIILINYNTLTGFEAKHSSIASALSLALLVYYLSKNKFTASIGAIAVIILINYFSIGEYKYFSNNIYKKFEKVNFTNDFINEMKHAKFKIDVCYLTFEENCTVKLGYNKNTLLYSYSASNYSHVTILELIKNKIDICIVDKTGSLNRIGELICTENENTDKNRNEIYIIRDKNFETPLNLYEYTKIATVTNIPILQCTDPVDPTFQTCKSNNEIYESLFHPGAGLYLENNAVGLDPKKLNYLNNKIFEEKLSPRNINKVFSTPCSINYLDPSTGTNYCYKEDNLELLSIEKEYKEKVELYDLK